MPEGILTAIVHIETLAKRNSGRDAQSRLNEAIELAQAIELDVVYSNIINLKKADAGRLIGAGHVENLLELVEGQGVELIIINHALTPIQQRNLERSLNAKVIDRTALILEIFGARAATREGVLQVTSAHLKYQKSRLVRSWTHLERQRGGRGFLGGPGETQIEADRRALDDQITAIEARIEQIRKTRSLHRAGRSRQDLPVIALVGYTNAGKSTLFNRLSGASVVAKDMLFATLDPTMRQVELPSGRKVIFSDTVGFISDLPTELVAAFRATLEEVSFADLILHVRDASNSEHIEQSKDVYQVLENIDAEKTPIIEVFNKIDSDQASALISNNKDAHRISALTGAGIGELLDAIDAFFEPQKIELIAQLDFAAGEARAWLYDHGVVTDEHIDDNGYHFNLSWDQKLSAQFFKHFGPILKS